MSNSPHRNHLAKVMFISPIVAAASIKFTNLTHDFTHSLYIHYIICQFKDNAYGLMTGLFAWISLGLSLFYGTLM